MKPTALRANKIDLNTSVSNSTTITQPSKPIGSSTPSKSNHFPPSSTSNSTSNNISTSVTSQTAVSSLPFSTIAKHNPSKFLI